MTDARLHPEIHTPETEEDNVVSAQIGTPDGLPPHSSMPNATAETTNTMMVDSK